MTIDYLKNRKSLVMQKIVENAISEREQEESKRAEDETKSDLNDRATIDQEEFTRTKKYLEGLQTNFVQKTVTIEE